jgi:hypothetical protein
LAAVLLGRRPLPGLLTTNPIAFKNARSVAQNTGQGVPDAPRNVKQGIASDANPNFAFQAAAINQLSIGTLLLPFLLRCRFSLVGLVYSVCSAGAGSGRLALPLS